MSRAVSRKSGVVPGKRFGRSQSERKRVGRSSRSYSDLRLYPQQWFLPRERNSSFPKADLDKCDSQPSLWDSIRREKFTQTPSPRIRSPLRPLLAGMPTRCHLVLIVKSGKGCRTRPSQAIYARAGIDQ